MRPVGRVALVLVSLVVIVWLAAGLRSLHDIERGAAAIGKARALGFPEGSLARARPAFDRARVLRADGPVLTAHSQTLALAGARGASVPVLERLVRLEPDDFDAWLLLYGATRGRDPATAQRARRVALSLNPLAEPLLGGGG